MAIRLEGSQEKIQKALVKLRASFVVLNISKFYANRDGGTGGRVYVSVEV